MPSIMLKTEDAKFHKSADEALVLKDEAKAIVDCAMVTLALAKAKVFRSVVLFVQIDVVDMLAFGEASSKSSLHNEPMLRHPSELPVPFNADSPISAVQSAAGLS